MQAGSPATLCGEAGESLCGAPMQAGFSALHTRCTLTDMKKSKKARPKMSHNTAGGREEQSGARLSSGIVASVREPSGKGDKKSDLQRDYNNVNFCI